MIDFEATIAHLRSCRKLGFRLWVKWFMDFLGAPLAFVSELYASADGYRGAPVAFVSELKVYGQGKAV